MVDKCHTPVFKNKQVKMAALLMALTTVLLCRFEFEPVWGNCNSELWVADETGLGILFHTHIIQNFTNIRNKDAPPKIFWAKPISDMAILRIFCHFKNIPWPATNNFKEKEAIFELTWTCLRIDNKKLKQSQRPGQCAGLLILQHIAWKSRIRIPLRGDIFCYQAQRKGRL